MAIRGPQRGRALTTARKRATRRERDTQRFQCPCAASFGVLSAQIRLETNCPGGHFSGGTAHGRKMTLASVMFLPGTKFAHAESNVLNSALSNGSRHALKQSRAGHPPLHSRCQLAPLLQAMEWPSCCIVPVRPNSETRAPSTLPCSLSSNLTLAALIEFFVRSMPTTRPSLSIQLPSQRAATSGHCFSHESDHEGSWLFQAHGSDP